jgi:hypothetical protein
MSRFTVRVEMNAFPKGSATANREENYDAWSDADEAFCAYRKLALLPGSIIQHVELIEHREEVVHKSASKPDASTNNVVQLGSAHHANG